MENLLKQMVNNTKPKRSFSIVVSDNKTRFKTWFKPPIQLDKKKDYEISLINLQTNYSFPNIDRSNNCFTYAPCACAPWFDIIIPEGSYHVEDINEFIHRQMKKNDHYDKENDKDNIEISANTNTLKSEMFLKNNYEVVMSMVPHNPQFPHNLLYLPKTADTIHTITIWLTDQNGNELGENLRTYEERICQCDFI